MKKLGAEFFGKFWLVLGGCGSAVLSMAYAIGHISGCHLNPAVSVDLWADGRFPANQLLSYIVAQVLGGGAIVAVLGGADGRCRYRRKNLSMDC